MKTIVSSLIAIGAVLAAGPALAQWAPSKPVEFIAAGGAGGGTDQFARQLQAAIAKEKLAEQNVVVANKGGGSGAEAFIPVSYTHLTLPTKA